MDAIERNLKHHVRVLCDGIGSRSILEGPNLSRAQDYIHGQFTGTGLKVSVQGYSACGVSTANLIATPGSFDPASPCLVLGAHYDTVPGTPGADDNASAVAVLLEVARLSSVDSDLTPVNTLFTAFSTEEPPCFDSDQMGSRVFIDSLADLGIEVEAALVLEMVGYYSDEPGSQRIPVPLKLLGFPGTGNFIAVVGNGRSRALVRAVSSAIADSGCRLPVESLSVPGSGNLIPETRLSDNASFWDAGIPAVMITDTSFFRNPHYHCRSDTRETLDYGKMEELVKGLTYFLTVKRKSGTGNRE